MNHINQTTTSTNISEFCGNKSIPDNPSNTVTAAYHRNEIAFLNTKALEYVHKIKQKTIRAYDVKIDELNIE